MLVVVEDRNVQFFLQAALDFKAARSRDVLEVDSPEARLHGFDDFHDLVDVLGAQAQRERVDSGEGLEQHRLAFHDRHGRRRPDVAETEDCGSVGYHGHGVVFDRQ